MLQTEHNKKERKKVQLTNIHREKEVKRAKCRVYILRFKIPLFRLTRKEKVQLVDLLYFFNEFFSFYGFTLMHFLIEMHNIYP